MIDLSNEGFGKIMEVLCFSRYFYELVFELLMLFIVNLVFFKF